MSWADENLPLGMEDLIEDTFDEGYTIITKITDNYEIKKIIIWVDRYDNTHYIDQMSTEYIERCIKYIKANNFRRIYLPLFEKELKKRKQQ